MSANVVGMCCGPAGVDLHIAADVPAQLPQPLQERPSPGLIISIVRACGQEHADPPHLVSRLLRVRRHRPRRRPAAQQGDELATPDHSITSSARASRVWGMVRPRAFAVTRLMIRSNLVGCSTGRSPGFAPRKILSTYSAARRNSAGLFGP